MAATPDPTGGLYQFTNMLFWLNGVVASFQRVMDKALSGMQDCVFAYVNDIFFSPSGEALMTHLRWVLEALRRIGLTANLKKSCVGHTVVQYLCFCIG